MDSDIRKIKEHLLDTLKNKQKNLIDSKDHTVKAVLLYAGLQESEAIAEQVDRKIGKLGSEIGNLNKDLGHPSQKQIKAKKKQALNNISDDARKAVWGTYGIAGKDPLKWVYLTDCSTDHLNAIMSQITMNINHPYIPLIMEILEVRERFKN